MAATIGKVSATFTSNTSGLKRGVQDAVASFGRLERGISGLRSGLSTLTAIAGAQLFANVASGAINAGRALAGWVQSSADTIDNLSKLAARTGFLYSELASLNLAADLAGVSTETLAGAMQRADRMFVLAGEGSKSAQQAFARVGLSLEDLQGLTDAQRFERITDAIADIPDPATRSAAAIGLFGRSGAQLIPLFSQGSGAIRQAAEEAQKFGLALNNTQGQNVEAMNDSFTRVGAAVQGIVNQVTAFLAPAVTNVANIFTDFIADVGGVNLGQAIGEGILEGALTLARIADEFIAGIGGVWEFAASVAEAWNATWDLGGRLFSFFSGIVNAFQAGLGAVILAFGKVAEYLVEAASSISEALGLGGFDQTIAGLEGFNQQIFDDMVANANAAATDFSNTFGDAAQRAADALPGPFESAVIDGIAAAREAAASIDQAIPREIQAKTTVTVQQEKQAVQGIESTSAEGIKEMFRLMRGDPGDDVQKQQLGVLEDIRDGIDDMGGDDAELAVVGF